MKIWKKISVMVLALLMMTSSVNLVGCKRTEYSNETTPLMFASEAVDKVFNPFFYTTGPDGEITGVTQISMLSSDKNGEGIAYGVDEPVVVLDMKQESVNMGTQTEYTFVLKNDIKFSDGVPLTIKDVLFNLYVYLDPVFIGSSTLYSVDIVGLKAFRANSTNTQIQDGFDDRFAVAARNRRQTLANAVNQVLEDNKATGGASIEKMKQELAKMDAAAGADSTLLKDYELAEKYFREELESDFQSAESAEASAYPFLSGAVEIFFYLEGYFEYDEALDKLDKKGINTAGMTKEQAIDLVFNDQMTKYFVNIITGWATASKIIADFTSDAMTTYFSNEERVVYNIEGITQEKSGVSIGSKTYAAPKYDAQGNLTEGHEVLKIRINGVDPKAIWNFGFSVAPMHYYSDAETVAKFDGEQNFGVKFGDADFFRDVLRSTNKIGVPMGAGPYKVSNKNFDNKTAFNIDRGEFFSDNIAYFTRNEHYLMGAPKIHRMCYQVVSKSQLFQTVNAGQIHFAQMDAKENIIRDAENSKSTDYKTTDTMGYGYIGINAGKIPNVYVRRALMYAMNTELCKDYYPGLAQTIYRPMSKQNWAYPTDVTTHRYPFDATGNKSIEQFVLGGYNRLNSNGKRINAQGQELKFTFTISGDVMTEHPAYSTMHKAKEVLEACGVTVNIVADPRALLKLSSGGLEVWAAAWGSSIDPDMFQTYHLKSKATSVLNWGYDKILADKTTYAFEYKTIVDLSAIIEEAREKEDKDFRKIKYKEALDLVMELAVELPTYQRSDLYVWNQDIIKTSSMTPKSEVTTFNGLLTKLWLLEFN